jgi:hypothetical protein
MPKKPRGRKPPVDRDKIVVRWIEEQQVEEEDAAPPPSKIVEMPTSMEERKRRLQQIPKAK